MKDMKDFYEGYWKYRKEIGHLAQKHIPNRLKVVYSMIKADKSTTDILDIGCGEGGLGMLLKEKYGDKINLFGIDISEKAVSLAKPYYNNIICVNVENDDISRILNNQKFDYIITVEVLEHLFGPEKLLDKLKNLLKHGGHIIVSFPNFAFWKNRMDLVLGHFPATQHLYDDLEHVHYWTYPAFTEFLNACMLEVEELDGDFIFPFSRFLPKNIVKFVGKKLPNFIGFQIVIKTKIKGN